ncbi:transcriptional regulator with PAS, ATPase and Fis domain [Caldalkalibacillus uzonensis]|uniref:HTH-type transcriptional regulatory protein TyrR n=1 Tax=Caldalkalibacillus uzonensis TaxID=353224 RepID=A0ABU0CPI7_9BACI|nr:sigma 54-interacting transcriptional regulator [Caldalkalibacillus uzonensis]MDQ0337804.1 transcriptional regulator with PAS, ATPase and Fis domain [Caldalkalibacillus uzonensis]
MFPIPPGIIRPIVKLSLDQPEIDWQGQRPNIKEPLIFLEEKGTIVAYVHLKDLPVSLVEESRITVNQLKKHARSIAELYILTETLHFPALFQTLGKELALFKDERGKITGYVLREDLLLELFKQENRETNFLRVLLASIPMGIFIIDSRGTIVNYNETGLKMIRASAAQVSNKPADMIFDAKHLNKVFLTGEPILNQIHITNDFGILVDYSPIINNGKDVEGLIIIVQDLPAVEQMAMELEAVKSINKDLNAVLSSIYDEILVVDAKGTILRHSDSLIPRFRDANLSGKLIGKNIIDLENKGLLAPSVTKAVMEKKERVSVVQETPSGKKVLAVGNPIIDDNGNIERIIIASRDITETTRLRSELREMKKLSARYKRELEQMKMREQLNKKLIYCSKKMEEVVAQVQKVAKFSSTVLIQGESGVGKEVIAQVIHQLGPRKEKPFLKINCGAIPETLLESELFGYVKGAFTGADPKGKDGYFKQADQGVLFLDEIGELPLHLQVKLLRVLQEREVTPIGSTETYPVDVQIIAATNTDLKALVAKGKFREDLFYRLNVIPIYVPPLRERLEDIPLLAFHFLRQLNKRYHTYYHLTPDALNLLEAYTWPGNIRELQNIIERLVVTADDEEIDAEVVSQVLKLNESAVNVKPVITNIMPLKEAFDAVEEQLITQAMKLYKTTTKAAKVLGISQSSVSRKYQKILEKSFVERSGE